MDKAGHQDIHQAGGHHAAAGVGEHLDVGDGKLPVCIGQLGGHNGKAPQKGEGGAQEGRDLAAGDQVEQQGAQPRHQQGGADAEAGDKGHQDGGAEHGEDVLKAQHQHLGDTQGTGVVEPLLPLLFVRHRKHPPSLHTDPRQKKKALAASGGGNANTFLFCRGKRGGGKTRSGKKQPVQPFFL